MIVLNLASERCVATDEICVKGVRGCFPTVGIFPFTGSSNLLTGITMLGIAVHSRDVVLPWWWLGALILQLIISMVIASDD